MKSHRFPFLLLVFVLILFSGCTRQWTGSYSSSLAIPLNQYHVVKRVTGQSKTLLIFGFGGLNHVNLIEEAKSDLILKTKLDSNQVLGDWMVSMRSSNILFWRRQHCDVQASVISLVPDSGAGKAGQAIAFAIPKFPKVSESRLILPPTNIVARDTVVFYAQEKSFKGLVQEVDGDIYKIWYFNPQTNSNEKVYRKRKEISKWKK
jgi:hypothetical protein